jgi:hypothetical protein
VRRTTVMAVWLGDRAETLEELRNSPATFTAVEVNRLRQLVNAVEDINPIFMEPDDWLLSAKLTAACGMRVSTRVLEKSKKPSS